MNSSAPTISSGGFEVLEIPDDQFHAITEASKPCQCENCNPQMVPVPAYFEYYAEPHVHTSSCGHNDRLSFMDIMLLIMVFITTIIMCVIIMRNYK